MSKMNQLTYDIEQLYIEGMSARMIALTMETPMELVLSVLENMGVDDVVESPQYEELYSPYFG